MSCSGTDEVDGRFEDREITFHQTKADEYHRIVENVESIPLIGNSLAYFFRRREAHHMRELEEISREYY